MKEKLGISNLLRKFDASEIPSLILIEIRYPLTKYFVKIKISMDASLYAIYAAMEAIESL